jgi:hypothetical protein
VRLDRQLHVGADGVLDRHDDLERALPLRLGEAQVDGEVVAVEVVHVREGVELQGREAALGHAARLLA